MPPAPPPLPPAPPQPLSNMTASLSGGEEENRRAKSEVRKIPKFIQKYTCVFGLKYTLVKIELIKDPL